MRLFQTDVTTGCQQWFIIDGTTTLFAVETKSPLHFNSYVSRMLKVHTCQYDPTCHHLPSQHDHHNKCIWWEYLKTQCAAVMTHRSDMRAPPQEILFDRRLSLMIAACKILSFIFYYRCLRDFIFYLLLSLPETFYLLCFILCIFSNRGNILVFI